MIDDLIEDFHGWKGEVKYVFQYLTTGLIVVGFLLLFSLKKEIDKALSSTEH